MAHGFFTLAQQRRSGWYVVPPMLNKCPWHNGAATDPPFFFFANFLGRFTAAEWVLVQLQVQQQRWDNCAGLARVQTPPPAPAAALSF